MTVLQSLHDIKEKMAAACKRVDRNVDDITIIGVTKYVTVARTKELLAAGVTNIGENRVEGLEAKYNEIGRNAKWHFIGTLQSRKVKDVIDKVHTIHSLDRLSVAKQINSRAEQVIDCFIQVNVSGEASKHGLEPDAVVDFVRELAAYDKVRIVGLMTMAPHIKDEASLRGVFRNLRELGEEINALQLPYAPCDQLSMGMSNDYEIAIEEGATHIRLGTTLVGNEME